MRIYQTKAGKLPGTEFKEVHKRAVRFYKQVISGSKRRPYVRSAYFKKEKIFLGLFWQHLFEKENWKDRVRRMKYFPPGIELIKRSHFEPKSKENLNKSGEILHRFSGLTRANELFHVQIKEDKKSGQKHLISIFPDL